MTTSTQKKNTVTFAVFNRFKQIKFCFTQKDTGCKIIVALREDSKKTLVEVSKVWKKLKNLDIIEKMSAYLYYWYGEGIYIWKDHICIFLLPFKIFKSVKKWLSYKCLNAPVRKNTLFPLSQKFEGILQLLKPVL